MHKLVLIPGLGNTELLFDPILGELSNKNINHINLIAPHVQNFGEMLDHVRSQLPDEPFDLLGFSMGGYVALALALSGAFPIRKLILVNSRAADDDTAEIADRARTLRLLENPKTRYEGMTPGLFKTLVGPTHQQDEAMFELVREMALDVGREGLAAQIRANQTRPNMVDDLAKVHLPTLIIGGELDKVTPPYQAERLHRGISGSKAHIFEGCGHLSPLERPAELAALLKEFIDA